MRTIFRMESVNAIQPAFRMAQPVSLEMNENEQWLITGRNGSGKSLLADMIAGRRLVRPEIEYDFSPASSGKVYEQVHYVSFCDAYGAKVDGSYYYQQRWNRADAPDDLPTVSSVLSTAEGAGSRLQNEVIALLRLNTLLDCEVVMLSSGELRRLLLAKALSSAPRLLILDSPFIGLDIETRKQLIEVLSMIVKRLPVNIILIEAFPKEIPEFVTHTVTVENRTVTKHPINKSALNATKPTASLCDKTLLAKCIRTGESQGVNSDEVIQMDDINIRYGDRTILSNLQWLVRQGERWALTGPNGSGKSTLLSLVCADNPQSYACHLSLFGRKRGTGESIWEIKKRIGYVSPELHRSFYLPIEALSVVASGFFDTVGLFRKPSDEQLSEADEWMKLFGLGDLSHRRFTELSSGEQRMVLLARAFVKNPDLLVLDEPFHGLDAQNTALVKELIEAWCADPQKTLIMVSHYTEDYPIETDHYLELKKRN